MAMVTCGLPPNLHWRSELAYGLQSRVHVGRGVTAAPPPVVPWG